MKEDIDSTSNELAQHDSDPSNQENPAVRVQNTTQNETVKQMPPPVAGTDVVVPSKDPNRIQSNTASPEQPKGKDTRNSLEKKPKPKRNSQAIPIGLAVIVLIALSGIAIFAKMDSGKSESSQPAGPASQSKNTQTNKDEDQQAIQASAAEIDSLPGETDSSGQDLSDGNLGL